MHSDLNDSNPSLTALEKELLSSIDIPEHKRTMFYKTTPGSYAAHDQFLGIRNPTLRAISKQYRDLSETDIISLLHSPFNEKRLLALLIMILKYKHSPAQIYQLYLNHIDHVNNWNLVDLSAPYILGQYLFDNPAHQTQFTILSQSNNLWHKRIAIVATQFFIRKKQFHHTISIANYFLSQTTPNIPLHQHDLIQKATGWMLREMGKNDKSILINFLQQNHHIMPRTMFRYAIEKLTPDEISIFSVKQ